MVLCIGLPLGLSVEFPLSGRVEAWVGKRSRDGSAKWNFYFDKTARCCGVDRGDNPIYVKAQDGPLLIANHDERDLAAFEVLLEAHVLVGRQEQLKSLRFGYGDKVAIREPIPAALDRFYHDVIF